MAIEAGQRLLHYRLIEKLGEGGMGVVWKARDTRLRRDVALKLLPPDIAQTAERRQRFLREARAAAAISHPHIAAVFEANEAEGHAFIAMELVKGATLRQHMKGSSLPVNEVLSIACQIADGLTHAHQAKVIHRDLKPDNIMIGSDGHVRILDFGLAKLREDEHLSREASRMTTISGEMTLAGKVFGTAAYMSPEQTEGATVDERSDTFSFGVTLYEIATGQLPFRGATPLDTMSAIRHQQPVSASSLNPEIPPELERILRKCLQKAPAERYQDSRDLLVDLRQLKRDSDSQPLQRAGTSVESAKGRARLVRWTVGGLGLAAAVFLAVWVFGLRGATNAPPDIQQRLLTTNAIDDPVVAAAISPDGKTLVYTTRSGVHLQILETGETKRITPLQGVENVSPSGWFPDSMHLALTLAPEGAGPSLWTYSMLTGALHKIRDRARGPDMYGAVSPDGRTLAFVPEGDDAEIWLMDADGSNPRRVVAKEEDDTTVTWWVRWSPDSRRILYRRQKRYPDGLKNSIESCDLQGQGQTRVVEPIIHVYPGLHAEWVPDGRVIFSRTEPDGRLRDNNLWEVPMDVATGTPRGQPRRLTSWVGFFSYYLTATRDGELAIVRWRTQQESYVASVDASGQRLQRSRSVMSSAMDDYPVAWMDDGRSLLIASNRRGNSDIHVFDLVAGSSRALVATAREEVPAAISPDGRWLLYTIFPQARRILTSDPVDLVRVPVDGGAPEPIAEIRRSTTVQCSSLEDGRCILAAWEDGTIVVHELDPFAGRGPVLAELPASAEGFHLSPDGEQLVWRESPDGRGVTLTLMSLSDTERRSLETGDWTVLGRPAWAAEGDGLFVLAKLEGRRAVLHVSLEGDMTPIWVDDEVNLARHLLPSPDGRDFAFTRSLRESTVWLLSRY